MTARDWRGLAVTGASEATLAALDDFSQGLLGYEPRAANLVAAADADHGCALAQAYAAMLHLFMETRSATAAALPYVARAEASSGGCRRASTPSSPPRGPGWRTTLPVRSRSANRRRTTIPAISPWRK